MSNEFHVARDNPFAGNMVNIYRDEAPYMVGEVLDNGMVQIPTVNHEGTVYQRVCNTLLDAEMYLNKYHGFTKGSARQYLGVK
jgi:hypothetical protein